MTLELFGAPNAFLNPPRGLHPSEPIIINVTESPLLDRQFNTVYQNLTDKLMLVVISVQANVGLTAGNAGIEANVDSFSPPTNQVAACQNGNPDGFDEIFTLSFLVPPLFFYEVRTINSGSGSTAKLTWIEYLFVTPFELSRSFHNDASRPVNTTFQNTTGKIILVATSYVLGTTSQGDRSRLVARVDPVSPPTTQVGIMESNASHIGNQDIAEEITFIVPPNWFYRLDFEPLVNGSEALQHWMEYSFIPPINAQRIVQSGATRPFNTQFKK